MHIYYMTIRPKLFFLPIATMLAVFILENPAQATWIALAKHDGIPVVGKHRRGGHAGVVKRAGVQLTKKQAAFVSKFGPMWGYRWARVLHKKVDGSKETEPPEWITKYPGEPAP